MTPNLLRLTALLPLAALSSAALAAPDFDRAVAPLLARRCLDCHSGPQPEAGLDLSRHETALRGGDSGPAIVPQRLDDSLLWQRVSAGEMPPDKPLPADEQSLLRDWISAGAAWDRDPIDPFRYSTDKRAGMDWWSLQPIVCPPIPRVAPEHDVRTPIDAFVTAGLAGAGLTPSPPADRTTLIRRLSLDLLGLPPTPEEVATFHTDQSPDAWERLVERTLASPHFGERWARHWLDVVRFAESHGFETNFERPNAYHYRDYVIQSLNADTPYDAFVFEQLAGDTVGAHAATGFLVGGAYDRVKGQDALLGLMQRQDELTDIVNTTGTAFLGLTLGCARCHNHKFDPVTQSDFYSLQAVFAGVQHDDRQVTRTRSPEQSQRISQLEGRRTELAAELRRQLPSTTFRDTIVIDDEDAERVELLLTKQGHGANPSGGARGHQQDAGGPGRSPNISGGRYTWWQPTPGADVAAWRPAREGEFRVWLSWGCGWSTHTTDAQYLLDDDGHLETRDDQHVIAVVDQQRFADGSGDRPGQPLWSGFLDAGRHRFGPESRLLLRCGTHGSAITADVIVLQADAAASAQPALRPPPTPTANEETFPPVLARAVRFTIHATNSGSEPCLDELEVWSVAGPERPPINVALASRGARASSSSNYAGDPKHQLEHVHDGRYGNGRSWISGEPGRGWVQIDFAEPVRIDRITWQRDREGVYADRTPVDYEIAVTGPDAGSQAEWRIVAASAHRAPFGAPGTANDYALAPLAPEDGSDVSGVLAELRSIDAELSALQAPLTMYAGRFEQPGGVYRLYRGDPLAPREAVAPAVLSVLRERIAPPELAADAPEQSRRVALAHWLTDPSNPLPARVMVNRLWQQHFGRGLVATPSDFGAMGARPTHPELLDWLAAELIESGWSLKHVHRLILHSATYRQSSAPRPECLEADAAATLLWRFPPRRIEAEAIRDCILAVSGRLDDRLYGPGFLLFHPNDNYSRNWVPRDEFGPADFRRMIYTLKLRMKDDAVFSAFDCPDGGQIMPARPRSTTPIQALNLLNSPFIVAQAEALTDRVRAEAGNETLARSASEGIVDRVRVEVGDDAKRQIAHMFQLMFGRDADGAELDAAKALVDSHGLPALARALLNSNEFLHLP